MSRFFSSVFHDQQVVNIVAEPFRVPGREPFTAAAGCVILMGAKKIPLRAEEGLKRLRQPGCPFGTRGFASPNCSGFAFVGL